MTATTDRRAVPDRLIVPCEFKAVEGKPGRVRGFASVFDVIDHHDDIVHAGAFVKTLRERLPGGLVKFLDSHMMSVRSTLGTVVAGEETTENGKSGLVFEALLSEADDVKSARTKIEEGHITRASIGYQPIAVQYEERDGKIVRHLNEVRLLEISAVPVGANDDAEFYAMKGIVPFQALPVAPLDTRWDRAAARKRVVEWAGRFDGAEGKRVINYAKARRAFLFDPDPSTDDVDHLQIADVVEGKLVAVPEAIKAAARDLNEREGEQSVLAARVALKPYLDDLGIPAPWEAKGPIEISIAAILTGCDPQYHESKVIQALGRLGTETKTRIAAALTAGTTAAADPPKGGTAAPPTGPNSRLAILAREADLVFGR